MSQSKQYVGLDVSLKETSICVIDDADKIVWRGQVDSTPEAIASAVKQHAPHAVRIGLKSGQLSSWLFHELKEAGLPVICVDARHAKAALSLKVNKTDANDALGLAQIMRVGWYREVTVKGLDCQAVHVNGLRKAADEVAPPPQPNLLAPLDPAPLHPLANRSPRTSASGSVATRQAVRRRRRKRGSQSFRARKATSEQSGPPPIDLKDWSGHGLRTILPAARAPDRRPEWND
jgi:Transposase